MADNQVDLKFLVDSKELTTANNKLDKMEGNLKDVNKVSTATATQFKSAGKNLGYQFQNAGYQVQDFIVQVQGGQGAMRALSQQGSQLLAIFGPVGVFAGIGLSLGTSIIPALMKATEEAKSLEDALNGAADASDRLMKENIKLGLGGASPELIAMYKEREAALEKIKELEKKGYDSNTTIRRGKNASYVGAAKDAQAELDVLEKQVSELNIQIAQNKTLKQLQGDQVQEAKNMAQVDAEARKARIADDRVRMRYAEFMAAANKTRGAGETDINRILKDSTLTIEQMAAVLGITVELSAKLKDGQAQAAKETARLAVEAAKAQAALSGLQNIGLGIARSIAVARAEVTALNNEANTGIATQIAGKRFDIQGAYRKSIADGANASDAMYEHILANKQLIEYEELLLDIEQKRSQQSVSTSSTIASGTQAQIEKAVELSQAMQNQIAVFNELESALGDGFMSMVDGTKPVKDAFREMARDIIKELYRVYVLQQLIGGLGVGKKAGTGLLGGIQRGLGLPNIPAKASGGTIMGNQPYLVGEKGPELIMPQNRGHVMNADLTSKALGAEGSVVVHQTQNFHFSANGDDSVKRIISQSMPAIVNASKAGVLDARRRGGVYGKAFG